MYLLLNVVSVWNLSFPQSGYINNCCCCLRWTVNSKKENQSLHAISVDQANRSPGVLNFQLTKNEQLSLKMASVQVVETSVANNSPSGNSSHPDDHFQSRYVTLWFKPFSW